MTSRPGCIAKTVMFIVIVGGLSLISEEVAVGATIALLALAVWTWMVRSANRRIERQERFRGW